jgi:F-type H+-transporting ATPase subunit epsilon
VLATGAGRQFRGVRRRYLAVSGGFIAVLPDQVRVMADVAERAEEINVERARLALTLAQAELAKASSTGIDPAEALAAIERANARIAAAESK